MTLEQEAHALLEYLKKRGLYQDGDTLLSCVQRHVQIPEVSINMSEDKPNFKFSADQEKAWKKLTEWQMSSKPYFILRGYSGSGKTTLLKMLSEQKNMLFTATTNKATKVLSKMIGKPCKTVYSQLGLRMIEEEEGLVLKPSTAPPYLPKGAVLVVDESSMIGSLLLKTVIETAAKYRLKVLFVGDPAQLPPVGEKSSGVWTVTEDKTCRALLKQVMRNGDAILNLSTKVRNCLINQDYEIEFASDLNKDYTGVHVYESSFKEELLKQIASGKLDFNESKVVAWRNKTVDNYNAIIREALGRKEVFCKDDLLMLAEPIEKNGQLIAHIDDEFTVQKVYDDYQIVDEYKIETWRLDVIGDDKTFTLNIPKKMSKLNILLSEKATYAKSLKSKARIAAWRNFWETKRLFHSVRYGYALTAHRAQGSTMHTAFVDAPDILINQNKPEAFRCLYVAVSRPTTNLHIV